MTPDSGRRTPYPLVPAAQEPRLAKTKTLSTDTCIRPLCLPSPAPPTYSKAARRVSGWTADRQPRASLCASRQTHAAHTHTQNHTHTHTTACMTACVARRPSPLPFLRPRRRIAPPEERACGMRSAFQPVRWIRCTPLAVSTTPDSWPSSSSSTAASNSGCM